MSVIYIGDRAVGKTELAKKLTSRQYEYVQVTNLTEDDLEVIPSIYDPATQSTVPTRTIDSRVLQMKVRLNRPVSFDVDWTDTPGEMWSSQWKSDHVAEWQKFLNDARNSQAILLLLPPYRNIKGLKTDLIDQDILITKTQWCNRFERWVEFFTQHCPKAEQIALCLNKADLFCQIEAEARELIYDPSGRGKDWVDRHRYVYRKYFQPLSSKIEKINSQRSGLAIRCFITTIYNRTLLELPWLYLASYLAI